VVENLTGTYYLEDLCVDWRIVFKWTTTIPMMKWEEGLFFMYAVEAATGMQKN
jgi:hypothetical protein